jgi:hypothetical protein
MVAFRTGSLIGTVVSERCPQSVLNKAPLGQQAGVQLAVWNPDNRTPLTSLIKNGADSASRAPSPTWGLTGEIFKT